jgi:predicted nuclease with TOPRIM domain
MSGTKEDTANTAILNERNSFSAKVSELEEELIKGVAERTKLQEDFTALDQKVVALQDEKKALEQKCEVK